MIDRLKRHWRLMSLALLIAIALLVLHGSLGAPFGHSYRHNMPWFDAFNQAFWAGDLYPRFLPDLWYGLGGVDFYFYAPMPFWITSILGAASCPGCEAHTVLSLGGAWMILLSMVSFFFLARRFFPAHWAGFSAFVYGVLPYHYLMDWFIRQAVGELAALIFVPLLILTTIRLIEEKRGGILFALSFAGIALSHLPTALMAVHLVAIIALWQVLTRYADWILRLLILTRFAIWGGLGAALSAFYWLPAIALLGDVSPAMLYNAYSLPTSWLLFDGRPEANTLTAPLVKAMLALAIITAGGAYLLLRGSKDQHSDALRTWIVGPVLFTAFMMSVLSYALWAFWILKSIQFPWRFLLFTDVSIALAMTVIVRAVFTRVQRPTVLAVTTSCFALVYASVLMIPQISEAVDQGRALDGAYDPTGAPEYLPPAFMQLTRERYTDKVDDDTSGDERYRIFFAETEIGYQRALDAFERDTAEGTLSYRVNDRAIVSVNKSQAGPVRLPIAYWPYWEAKMATGEDVSLLNDPKLGVLRFEAPAGTSEIHLRMKETWPQRAGSGLSLLSLIALFVGILWFGLRPHPVPPSEKPLARSLG